MPYNYTYQDTIQTDVLVHELRSSSLPVNYLTRFPDEVYNKSSDSALYKFIFSLVGPSGVGALQKEFFKLRLELEAHGLKEKQLERFYGNALRFSKLATEEYSVIPSQLLKHSDWAEIKIKDEQYRTRAIDYLHAARLGSSPNGMMLAAKSGLGKDVEIVENYKFLFDVHSDDPVGFNQYGKTTTTSEFVILPHYEVDKSYGYTLIFDPIPNSGAFSFSANNLTSDIRTFVALNAESIGTLLKQVGINARVGGDYINGFTIIVPNEIEFTFKNDLYQNGTPAKHTITEVVGSENAQGVQNITIRNQYDVQLAVDYLKPVGTVFTYYDNQSSFNRQSWTNVTSTSNRTNVIRFVTGASGIPWPTGSSLYWIEKNVEKEAPRVDGDERQHYQAFHQPVSVLGYTDAGLSDSQYATNTSVLNNYRSYHIGNLNSKFPYNIFQEGQDHPYLSSDAIPVQAETKTSRTNYKIADGQYVGLINGIYPANYLQLQNVPREPKTNRLWISKERAAIEAGQPTSEILEIDLGTVKAINFLIMEVAALPFDIKIEYDVLDEATSLAQPREFVEVTPEKINDIVLPFEQSIFFEGKDQNPWEALSYNFTDSSGNIIFTRFVRITFTRRNEANSSDPLFYDRKESSQIPWSIAVKNLRVGRNV